MFAPPQQTMELLMQVRGDCLPRFRAEAVLRTSSRKEIGRLTD